MHAGGFGQRHAVVRGADGGNLRGRGFLRGQGGAFRLDQQARFQEVEGADIGGFDAVGGGGRGRVLILAVFTRLAHKHARAHAHIHIALDFQGDQGFSYRRPADLQLLGQLALGGQAAARGKVARLDARGDLVGNHAVKAG
ncbi:hypothetical protein D3C87_1603530 [compost metagenome]